METEATKCRELWLSVIKQAMDDYLCVPKPQRKGTKANTYFRYLENIERERSSVSHWIFREKLKDVGSLNWICEHVDIDIEYVREKAKELRLKLVMDNKI